MFIQPYPQRPLDDRPRPSSPDPKVEIPSKDSLARDIVSVGAAGLAGTAGSVVGLGSGLVKGGIRNYPAHLKKGARTAAPWGATFGKVAGCTGAAVLVAGMVALSPVAAVGCAATGFGWGTLKGAAKIAKPQIKATTKPAARLGKSALATVAGVAGALVGGLAGGILALPTLISPGAGMLIIPNAAVGGGRLGQLGGKLLGGVVGTVVGGAVGVTLGTAVSVVKGAPEGIRNGWRFFKQGLKSLKKLPGLAKRVWAGGKKGGESLGNGAGQLTGGSVGLLTGTAATLGDGFGGSAQTAKAWGSAAFEKTQG